MGKYNVPCFLSQIITVFITLFLFFCLSFLKIACVSCLSSYHFTCSHFNLLYFKFCFDFLYLIHLLFTYSYLLSCSHSNFLYFHFSFDFLYFIGFCFLIYLFSHILISYSLLFCFLPYSYCFLFILASLVFFKHRPFRVTNSELYGKQWDCLTLLLITNNGHHNTRRILTMHMFWRNHVLYTFLM
jgi:hypothetical protein